MSKAPATLPPLLQEVADAWRHALEDGADFAALQNADPRAGVAALKAMWNRLVPLWDERTFYDFLATSHAFANRSFRHREMFGQVGFGTGGWDSDFPNSMLEILRVVATDADDRPALDHRRRRAGAAWTVAPPVSAPRIGRRAPALAGIARWRAAPGVTRIAREARRTTRARPTVGRVRGVMMPRSSTCHTWLLTTQHRVATRACSRQKMWMALDRTRYMQSSKTFVMVDRPFWKDVDPATGRDVMSMTLTDRLTRGTYLFDNGPDRPGCDLPAAIHG